MAGWHPWVGSKESDSTLDCQRYVVPINSKAIVQHPVAAQYRLLLCLSLLKFGKKGGFDRLPLLVVLVYVSIHGA